jgi:hypothetical protein
MTATLVMVVLSMATGSALVTTVEKAAAREMEAKNMDHIPRCPCSHYYVIQIHNRLFHVVEEFIARAVKGLDLRLGLKARPIR